MPTFNSRTKCVGSPGIIHDRTTDCQPGHRCIDDLITDVKNLSCALGESSLSMGLVEYT